MSSFPGPCIFVNRGWGSPVQLVGVHKNPSSWIFNFMKFHHSCTSTWDGRWQLNCIHPILLDDEFSTQQICGRKLRSACFPSRAGRAAQCQTLQCIRPLPHPQLPQFHSCVSTAIMLKSWWWKSLHGDTGWQHLAWANFHSLISLSDNWLKIATVHVFLLQTAWTRHRNFTSMVLFSRVSWISSTNKQPITQHNQIH